MPVPSGWWYHLSVIEPTRQVLGANHWTVPLSCIPNSSYTRYKLDHKHDPYPSPSLVNISGASSSGSFTVPGHTYDIGSTESRASTWSTWWLATASSQGNSHLQQWKCNIHNSFNSIYAFILSHKHGSAATRHNPAIRLTVKSITSQFINNYGHSAHGITSTSTAILHISHNHLWSSLIIHFSLASLASYLIH